MTRYLIRFEDGAASIVEADRIVSFEERANQYLAERAIDVLYADGDYVAALCQGCSKTYRLGFATQRGWWCSCRIQGECPHLLAVKSVVGTMHESPRRVEVEAEASRARARYRATFEEDPAIIAQRGQAERVPELEAALAELRDRVEEIPELRTALERSHAEAERLQGELAARGEEDERRATRMSKLEQAVGDGATKNRQLEQHVATLAREAERATELEARLRDRDSTLTDLRRELERARAEAARVPQLDAQLQNQALRLSELKADTAQKLSQHRLQLMERDIKVNELQMELQRLRARAQAIGRPAVRRPQAGAAASPPRAADGGPRPATSAWTGYAVPSLSRPNGEGAEDPEPEPEAPAAAE